MGKKQHQKDKLYLTTTEWREQYGGKRANDEYHTKNERSEFKRLPFDHCSLSLQPFKKPVSTTDGIIYEEEHIAKFLVKHGVDPYSGRKMKFDELITLKMTKNSDGAFHCPVLFKVFTQSTHIVTIRTTGNVYCYEAVDQLNLKAQNLRDLLDDTPFTRKDIIDLQNPLHLEKFNISDFYYIKNNIAFKEQEVSGSSIRKMNNITAETLKELAELEKEKLEKEAKLKGEDKGDQPKAPQVKDKYNQASYSTGRAAAAFTSTVMDPVRNVEAALLDQYEYRYPYVKKKGYVRLVTNLGNLNLELHCDKVTKTCDNFITLCKRGYYNGTKFHRLIKHFMIQGGDPTGTGRGGQSAFGEPFEDEINKMYSHDTRGILSMANAGTDTNKSQFFITFRPCKHLDEKHTIFGRVVGGMDVLSKMEATEVDDNDKPKSVIEIIQASVFVDPYKEAEEIIEKEREKKSLDERNGAQKKKKEAEKKVFRSGVGSFIDLDAIHKRRNAANGSGDKSSEPKKAKISDSFGSFSNW